MKKGKLTPIIAAALLVFTSSIACAGNYAVTVKMKGQALTGEFVYQADLTCREHWPVAAVIRPSRALDRLRVQRASG